MAPSKQHSSRLFFVQRATHPSDLSFTVNSEAEALDQANLRDQYFRQNQRNIMAKQTTTVTPRSGLRKDKAAQVAELTAELATARETQTNLEAQIGMNGQKACLPSLDRCCCF